ncbi:dihydroorotate dehydrogenase [Candidatus Nitrosocosmicus hydrocola]|uniref:dihydroorotate dehydrogenase n=1 Tax=Candidatus Nitrosocosmicus hydrocola TaxID=1826872 RepID=UPI000A3E0102|nr:dihydroorotate dehydrogenase [Candidatus Nitrosocosmicus hydrocola]
MDYNVPISFAGLDLKNPVMIASGILGLSQNIFDRLIKIGAGAIVSKSISNRPRIGYRNPTVVPLENQNWLNAVGLANPGADVFSEEISNNKVPLMVSIVGSSTEEFRTIVQKFENSNIVGFELNLSCPHVEKMGMEIGDDPNLVGKIVKSIKDLSSKPLIVKVGLGKSDILQIAKVAEEAGADGITAINTLRAMKIDITNKCPVLENKIGGLSGAAIRPIGVRCVYELYKVLKVPIIGCGGILTISDMLEYIMAGASAVQVGSYIAQNGMDSIGKLVNNLQHYLKTEGYSNLEEIVGIAHR